MKKLIGTVVLAAMVAGAAFAEINIGDWGRALWTISNAYDAGADKTRVVSDMHQSWTWDKGAGNGASPRVGFTLSGSSDNIGFDTQIFFNGNEFGAGDTCAAVWVKPIEAIKFSIAAGLDWNVLRGDMCLPLWGWDRIGIVSDEEGWIFPEMLEKNILLQVTPIEGLIIAGGFNVPCTRDDIADADDSHNMAVQLGRTSALAVGYTIDGIGTIKAGFQAKGKGVNKDGESKDCFEIDAAFELTGIEGLYVGIGAKIPVGGKYAGGTWANYNTDKVNTLVDGKTGAITFEPIQIATGTWVGGATPVSVNLGVGLYMVENLAIQIRGGVAINAGGYKKVDGEFGFLAEAAVTYSFGEGFSVFADLGYANDVWMQKKNGCFTFGVGIDKGFSNGTFGVAFEGATNGQGRYSYKDDGFAWCVPVRIQHWF